MALPRYQRAKELATAHQPVDLEALIASEQLEEALAASSLSEGAADLVRGLRRLGKPAIFAGGGIGIEYGSLLKTACDPRYLRRHVHEAAAHLQDKQADVLIVPGMSGYPIGSMYAIVANLPVILLKKQHLAGSKEDDFPAGSFVIPSYTGDGDVVMSADLNAVQDIVDRVLAPQLEAQQNADSVHITLRLAGADDIIDKATMSQAVSDSGLIVGRNAMEQGIARYRAATGDDREITFDVLMVAWVTPLIKGYNNPQLHLQRLFGVTPFAGLNVVSLHHDPPVIGIEHLGLVRFS